MAGGLAYSFCYRSNCHGFVILSRGTRALLLRRQKARSTTRKDEGAARHQVPVDACCFSSRGEFVVRGK